MRKVCRLVALLTLLIPLSLIPDIAWADTLPDATTAADTTAAANLKALLGELDQIRQQASTATGSRQLADLDAATQQLAGNVDRLLTDALLPERAKLQTQLDVLGPPPAPGALAEPPTVAQQRIALTTQQTQLDAELKQAQGAKDSLVILGEQLTRLQHDQLKDQLALRSGSILGMTFWGPLIHPDPTDHQRLAAFLAQIGEQLQSAWQPAWRITTTLLLLLALVIWTAGNRLLERLLAWLSLRHLPEGRLRRSAIALSTTVTSLLCTACAVRLIDLALTRQQPLPVSLQDFADELVRLALICALIAGLGRALLCTHHPSWRLPAIADPVALAIKPFPRILAGLLLLSGALEQLNRTVDTSLQVTLFGRGLVSTVVALTIGAALLRANRVRSTLAAAGQAPEARSTLAGLIHAAISLTVASSLFALLSGYISIARFLTYELVWFDLVLCTCFLLVKLTQDICESVFSVHHSSGRTIKHLLGLDDKHLEQASTILSGICKSLLLLLAVIALLTGGLGTTPADLVNTVLDIFGGDRLRGLNIVPGHILNALLTFGISLYVLRSVRKWLDQEFLPKTGMGAGMRASLLTLFVNLGYVLVTLLALSALGVKWDSLAWIVSALSVGIGFGLQEIVKNFISGLIRTRSFNDAPQRSREACILQGMRSA